MRNLRQLTTALLFLAFAASMSSCNRGYGCPSNFNIQPVVKIVQTTIQAIR